MDLNKPLALALVLGGAVACDNEVELLSDDPGSPVVYGLINGSEDRQLLSVSRTFRFSADGNALESAREQDSVYYSAEDLTVVARNLRSGLSTTLTRTNLAEDSDVVRDEGIFPVDPNVAYVWRLSDIEAAPGDSVVVEGALPGGEVFAVGGELLRELTFRSNGAFPTRYSLTADQGTTPFRWRRGGDGGEIAVFEVGLNFAFNEVGPDGAEERVLYYPLLRNLELSPDRNAINVDNTTLRGLYGFLSSRLEADPAISRQFQYVQAVITGGDRSYVEFQTLLRANSGITATQELPPFSNVEGGLGLVGIVTQLVQQDNAGLLPASIDSLRQGSVTADLNFR